MNGEKKSCRNEQNKPNGKCCDDEFKQTYILI